MDKRQAKDIEEFIYHTIAFDESKAALSNVLQKLGQELELSAVYLLCNEDTPLIFEVRDCWERDAEYKKSSVLLEFPGIEDDVVANPFWEMASCISIDNTEKADMGDMVKEFAFGLEASAIALCPVVQKTNFLGFLAYVFREEPHSWDVDERDLLSEVSKMLYHTVLRIMKARTQEFLLDEASRQARDVNRVKSQFMSNVSHEIRTPINSIVGMLSIMRHNINNPEAIDQCLDRLDKSAKQIMDLVNDCIDMTLLNNDEMILNEEWVAVADIVKDVRKVVNPYMDVKQHSFSVKCDENISINVDRAKLTRILVNVVSNAAKFSPENGKVDMSISIDKVGDRQSMFTCRVTDNGVGMTEEQITNMFEPFYKVKEQKSEIGTGLSMVIAKHFTEMMRGTLDVFSEPNKGTEVVIALPLEVKGETVKAKDTLEEDSDADLVEMYIGRRILIAEDNILMGEILATILGYKGFETDTALNGKEALDLFLSHDPFFYDMILMDIQMPVMDGIEAAKGIRASGRADADLIPIAALSANAMSEDVQKSLDAGMNVHLSKPVGEKELFETISNYVM